MSIGFLSREALAIGGSSRSIILKWPNGLQRCLVRKVMMFAKNAEGWRWGDVWREEVGEGESKELNF